MMRLRVLSAAVAVFGGMAVCYAENPTAEQALGLKPVQVGVDFDIPAADMVARCKISVVDEDGQLGWEVRGPSGELLRRFLDTNSDKVVDQWSYFKNGLEVYRDIDADYNGKADQYRWFHMNGTRWGLDLDEDGTVDRWKRISPEEVSAECLESLKTNDSKRFAALRLSAEEARKVGLNEEKSQELARKLQALDQAFRDVASAQKDVTAQTEWIQFDGNRPGLSPPIRDGESGEVEAYENVLVLAKTGEKHHQVRIGTLIRVGDAWRVIDAPEPVSEGGSELASGGFLFQGVSNRSAKPGESEGADRTQQILAELEKIDQAAEKAADGEEIAKLNAKRADLLAQVAKAADSPEDREMWLRQLADMVSAAVLSGTYPEGGKKLSELYESLKDRESDRELAAYVQFRLMTADYAMAMQQPKADHLKIQQKWISDLEGFVQAYANSPESAEAMLQLAMNSEFSGEEEDAKKWYKRIAENFPQTTQATKAAGAHRRLNSEGKRLQIVGKSATGNEISLEQYTGVPVLVQYWASWCHPYEAEVDTLKQLAQEYGNSKLQMIGVCLDSRAEDMQAFVREHKIPWPQIFQPGGLDSPLANELGIVTVPTLILVDKEGKVVNRNIRASEVADALEALGGKK